VRDSNRARVEQWTSGTQDWRYAERCSRRDSGRQVLGGVPQHLDYLAAPNAPSFVMQELEMAP